ncbi:MAG: site-specific integrase [Oscillospiraceae bacterium]|nr:site-specific integrase [Oscillospiraceae bacterium]
MKQTDFATHLTKYLSIYLPGQRGISVDTIKSYSDTFRLFLIFCRDCRKVRPEKISLQMFTDKLIIDFLDWLEVERGNAISTRNQRLAAIHAFCRYLLTESPNHMAILQRNLAVSFKKYTKPQLGYLSAADMTEIFSGPDLSTANGRRDLAILSLLYDSGARVSELVNLHARDIRLDDFPTVTLHGKGQKMRHVPLMSKTAELLKKYISENHLDMPQRLDDPLFVNRQKQKLTRAGVKYILTKYADGREISPHTLRHTKAMHLLQSGVNIVYIRDILGHSSVDTTDIYARADAEMKRKAIEKLSTQLTPDTPDWRADNALIHWLKTLG